MKDWVHRTLKICRPETISEESWEQEINLPVFAWRRLAGLMNTNWMDQRFRDIFGSVLASLSEKDFLELFKMRNLYFILPERLGEIHGFSKGANTAIVVCVFSPAILLLSDIEIRGVIAHELGHIFEKHYTVSESRPQSEIEEEADARAISLGFGCEIEELREGRTNSKKEE